MSFEYQDSAAELYNIAQDRSEKNNLAAQNPEKVAQLQKRANELAATMVKTLLLETEIKAMLQRLAMPPALPDEEFEFNVRQGTLPAEVITVSLDSRSRGGRRRGP